ncbi:MAG: hypothetical protein DI535_08495 [Citrobacter freundii]|nr:MAG: hypothetical protein DI535_08495 [Citrobacter freundii]
MYEFVRDAAIHLTAGKVKTFPCKLTRVNDWPGPASKRKLAQPLLQLLVILSKKFLRSGALFTIIYNRYISIYNPDLLMLKGSK